MADFRPRRTVLYLPASNARALEKARTLPADSIILDLEDAVAPEMKETARDAAVQAVGGDFGGSEVGIRVNAIGTPWCDGDLAAVAKSDAAFVVVPKVDSPAQAAEAVAKAGGKTVYAMIETPRAVLKADEIADVPGIAALIAGFADLTKDLRAKPGPDRLPLVYSASRLLLAARAAGIMAFDGVFTGIGDAEGLTFEAKQALEMGFDGKTCIHPSQLDIVNSVFSPTEAEIEYAQGMISAHDEAMAEGKAVATYKGKMVEVLHVLEARRTLKIAEEIARMA